MGSLFCFPHSVRLSFFYLAYFVEVRWKLILESIMVRAFSVHRKSFLKTMKCMFCLSCSTYSICALSLSSCFGVGAYSIFWVTLALNLQLSFVLSARGSLGERFINNELKQYSTFQGSLKTFTLFWWIYFPCSIGMTLVYKKIVVYICVCCFIDCHFTLDYDLWVVDTY